MAVEREASRRALRLKGLFQQILAGERPIRTSGDAELFLEAIQSHKSPGSCIETVISSKSGVSAIRDAVRVNISTSFALFHILPFLKYLSDPGIKALVDGQLLQELLLSIVQPPTVWNMLFHLFQSHQIPQEKLCSFAWLALELLSLPLKTDVDFLGDVRGIVKDGILLKAESHEVRELGYRVKRELRLRESPRQTIQVDGPGGRHDNDHANFRDIHIYPTSHEFLSNQLPYYQTVQAVFDVDISDRTRIHVDNQFRLLREDMLAEMREDIHIATGIKKGKQRALTLGRFVPFDIDVGDEKTGKFKKCCLAVQCSSGLQFLEKMDSKGRMKFLKNEPSFLKHRAFGVLCRGNDLLSFAFVDRNADLLAKSPPVVLLQFIDPLGLRNALLALQVNSKTPLEVQFILVGTPVFAYEPVLDGLKQLTELPLGEVLLSPAAADFGFIPPPLLRSVVKRLQVVGKDVNVALDVLGGKIKLDEAQLDSLISALTSQVSLIQGPPGTGKSFVGAQIAKCIHKYSSYRILVISYTNHALDQFLGDLLNVGIPGDAMVRLGAKAKCTAANLPLLLSEQKSHYRRSQDAWKIINALKFHAQQSANELKGAFSDYRKLSISWQDISEILEFSDNDRRFYEALLVPGDAEGWRRAGKGGKRVGPDYLYQRWRNGEDAGIFKSTSIAHRDIWCMGRPAREGHIERWMKSMVMERLEAIQGRAREFNDIQGQIEAHFGENDVNVLINKRVIGCTTTAAAKYSKLIRAARPDVILVEEAGEILESHILTAMTPTVKQLILIGDHKQLRPKINNYALTVEKGNGFDLNRSLFERMIIQGAPHTTLCKQHRMVPEISIFPRRLTYPQLLDGPNTSNRPVILGLQDHVIFFNHGKREDSDIAVSDRRDPGSKSSKTNIFEAEMVLRVLKYLGQQGYGSEQIVILTPYLGQLRVLGDLLRCNQHDPELSELDRFELIRAGLLTQAAAKLDRKPVRISTIDNYQGEESDIVIASLTRSNESGDIGFMAAPERLNVLITRARNCFVLIGNMETFMASKKGKATWHTFFDLLKEENHLYDGLPVKCERHPDRTAMLKEPIDFDKACPDGGCAEICGTTLKCGVHKCTFRCHRISDHTKAECRQVIAMVCNRQHNTRVACGRQQDNCRKCILEDREQERRIRRDLQLEEERIQRQATYANELQEVQDEIDLQRRKIKYQAEAEEQKNTLSQQRADLAALRDTQQRLLKQKQKATDASRKSVENNVNAESTVQRDTVADPGDNHHEKSGTTRADWEHLKKFDGAKSQSLDTMMGMVGLEDVKREFLSIKLKVDTTLRQGVSLASERFSCSLLGNPGTGKTTVARIYAQFLTDVGVIPGSKFKETSGSNLAHLGVTGSKQLLDEILSDGGGVLFIDEAYQLTSGHNSGGRAVLDHLLAEVENLTGKVVFVLAGYTRQMEGFFAHNPGLPSRFPVQMLFADYNDNELLQILELNVKSRYRGHMRYEGGPGGLFCRIVARRIGRLRGGEGFGNARAVQNALANICQRQSDRLQRERLAKAKPDDFLFTGEDLIGPEPTEALQKCVAWRKLQGLFGLVAVKVAVKSLVDSIQQNYQRELHEQPPIEYSLNKVFLGNPGTGKTTVAKLYGEILVTLGLLSKADVVVKNPSDFVGAALGQSELQTKGILAATMGKVLVIDEAYGLNGGGGNQGSTIDPYKTAVVDTIVAEVQSVPGDDRCVLLLGYRDNMEAMFQNANPGLSRRFPMASAFVFEDFAAEELGKILDLKLIQQGYRATDQAKGAAMDMLCRARNRPNFGNAGEIDIIMATAKARHQTRISKGQLTSDNLLQAQDFDGDFDRAERSVTNVQKLFEGTVGCDHIVELLEGYQETVRTMKSLEIDPKDSIPFNFLFRGPPGTGKTTTAKKMGKVFYDMGFLANADVVECSATDLIGQYVGHTGPKVQQLLDKALGKVLFIDEAYRLAEGQFAKEAVDELVDSVTKDRYHKKLVIILAGYEADINRLMSVNPGLTSRFPEVIGFRALTPDECIALLLHLLQGQKTLLKSRRVELDLSALETSTVSFTASAASHFSDLVAQSSWANARDVNTLGRSIFNQTIKAKAELVKGYLTVREGIILATLKAMASERGNRAVQTESMPYIEHGGHAIEIKQPPLPQQNILATVKQRSLISQNLVTDTKSANIEHEDHDAVPHLNELKDGRRLRHVAQRDAGVSDEIWEQLQRDHKAEEKLEEEHRRLVESGKKATGEARERIVKRLVEEEARRRRQAEQRERLEASGLCPAGYAWIKQRGGFRCGGGSHFVADDELT